MNSLDTVIKTCKLIQRKYEKQKGEHSIEASYYRVLVKYLLLENKHKEAVKAAGKPIYHYFMYHLPEFSNSYFEWLYNPHNPVRFALETFDSIQEIWLEINYK